MPALNERVHQLEHRALISGGELFDAPEPLPDAGLLGGDLLLEGLDAEEFVGGDVQGLGEINEEGAGRLGPLGLLVGDPPVGDVDGVPKSCWASPRPSPPQGTGRASPMAALGGNSPPRAGPRSATDLAYRRYAKPPRTGGMWIPFMNV